MFSPKDLSCHACSAGPRTHAHDYIMQSDEESSGEKYGSLPKYLCSVDKNIHQTSSTDFRAAHGEQLPVGKSLIEPGANCNTRYNDGKTSFFHADTRSSLDVRTLKEGVASLDVQLTRDTCRPGETDSKSDEETVPAKLQRKTDPQTQGTGGANDGAQQFAIKMAAIIGLRGKEKGDNFELSTNVTGSGNFDIIYTTKGRRYFLQLKYADNPGTNKLLRAELKPLLNTCFKTYISMADRDKWESIIYTTQYLESRLLEYTTEESDADTIFKTSDKGKHLKFTADDNKNYAHTLLEESMTEYKCLSDQEKKSQHKEFLNKLIIITGQKDQWELDDLIAEEIRNQDVIQVDPKKYSFILHYFKTLLENWWRSKKRENMTPDMLINWLQRAKTEAWASDVSGWFETCTKKLVTTGIQFSDSEVSRLQDKLSNNRAVHLSSDALTLCSILLLDCLDTSKCIFVTFELLQSNKDMLLHAWLGGHWEWLIVFCDSAVQQSVISDTCSKISEKIQCAASNKRVIILTACSVLQITDFVPRNQTFDFEQLSEESQEIVLDKKIDFQGCEVTIRSVLQRYGNVQHVLGPELVTDLITEGTSVNIGGRLQPNTGHYEPRVLKNKIWLSLVILQNRDTYPDVFAVSGMKKNELVKYIASEEEVGEFQFEEDPEIETSTKHNEVSEKRFIVLQGRDLKSSFSKLCEIHSRQTLHWLKYKDGKLLWKETHGDIENLLNFVDAETKGIDKDILRECMKSGSCEVNEEAIWDLGERTVLVVAQPGMGKSSTTTQVAWNTKLADPTSWILRINWNDHTEELQKIDAKTLNLDTLVEFLCSAAFPESKYTDINRNLLKQELQSSGNVTVLMDGFDEICPTHADKAAVILSELMKTNVARVWVTSRPVEKERLKRKLPVIAWNMKKLSFVSQESILRDTCRHKVNLFKYNKYLTRLIDISHKIYADKNITGTPAYIKTIATALELFVEMQPVFEVSNVPNKDGFSSMYKKIWVFYETVRRMDEEERKPALERTVNGQRNIFLEKPLGDEEIQSKIPRFIKRVQAGKDKIGIVMNEVEDRPHFFNRTFAKYSTARRFSKISSQTKVPRNVFFSTVPTESLRTRSTAYRQETVRCTVRC